MNGLDLTIVVLYLVALFGWAIYIGLKETAEDFLVLSRKAPVLLVASSMISTWVGSGTMVATSSSGYDTGISLGVTAASGGLIGVLVAAWFAPILKRFGDRFKAHTIGDFFAIRYSHSSRMISSLLIFIIYLMLTAAQFVGMSTLVHVWTGVDFSVVILVAAVSTIIYTAFAGIKSDFYTDVVHFVVMIVVVFGVLLPVTVENVGGFDALATLPKQYFDPFAYGGISFFVAGMVFGAAAVFVTMEVWQRVYASSTAKTARLALLLSVGIIICFYLAASILGMYAFIVTPDLVDRDQALFVLMQKYLPSGILGIGIAGFVAVFVSTVNSTIMVASATLTKDFYKGIINKDADQRRLLLAGRIATLLCGGIGLCIALILPDLVALSVNSLFLLLVLVPAIVGGFFWRRASSSGATSSMVVGLLVTGGFMIGDPTTAFVPGFVASLLTFVVVSLFTVSKNPYGEVLRRIVLKQHD